MANLNLTGNDRKRLSTVKLHVPDIVDGQVWVQSSIADTHKLIRGQRDAFSFTEVDLLVVGNRGEDRCTLTIDGDHCAESGILIGSTRRACMVLRQGERRVILLKAGEVLTIRSLDMCEPHGKHADGSPIRVRPGQSYARA